MKAHANAVENLVVFAALVLLAQAVGVSGGAVCNQFQFPEFRGPFRACPGCGARLTCDWTDPG